MLRIRVTNRAQLQEFVQATGPVEFGRGPGRSGHRRIRIADDSISRDQLRVEELAGGRVRVENLSHTNPVKLSGGAPLPTNGSRELDLPLSLAVQHIRIELDSDAGANVQPAPLKTIAMPAYLEAGGQRPEFLPQLNETPPPATLIHWLETVVALHREAVSSTELFEQTAKAVVELIGLDVGMVLLRHDQEWSVAAQHAVRPSINVGYSRSLLQHVAAKRRTFYQDLAEVAGGQALSLLSIDAAVVSPIFGVQNEVIGMVYGVRQQGSSSSLIRPLEAQLVQLLAATVSSHLTRAIALQTRVQFEQFFSPELARELERHPDLLEGRDQEVTILVSDLRGYTSISERLGAASTCRLVRDMMERLSQCIAENGGVIVDYAGDGILAMWNAPVSQPDHAARACRAALAMLGELPGLNSTWQSIIASQLKIGIGINSGMALVGNTGSSRKFMYGPLGHTVNVASRVERATKTAGVPVLLTAATRERLPPAFVTRPVPPIPMAGVAEPVPLYELVGEEPLTVTSSAAKELLCQENQKK